MQRIHGPKGSDKKGRRGQCHRVATGVRPPSDRPTCTELNWVRRLPVWVMGSSEDQPNRRGPGGGWGGARGRGTDAVHRRPGEPTRGRGTMQRRRGSIRAVRRGARAMRPGPPHRSHHNGRGGPNGPGGILSRRTRASPGKRDARAAKANADARKKIGMASNTGEEVRTQTDAGGYTGRYSILREGRRVVRRTRSRKTVGAWGGGGRSRLAGRRPPGPARGSGRPGLVTSHRGSGGTLAGSRPRGRGGRGPPGGRRSGPPSSCTPSPSSQCPAG